MIRGQLIAAAALGLLTVGSASAQPEMPDFAVGQVWSIRADPPTTTKVVIDRIEDFGGRRAVHVSVVDVPVPAGVPVQGPTMMLAHMPFDAEALRASVDKVVGSRSPRPEFEAGYQQWRSAKGGVFTISVSKALEVVFQSVPRPK